MARPSSGKDWKTPITVMIDKEIEDQVKFITDAMMAKKSSFLSRCIEIGLEELKKSDPVIAEASRNFKERNNEPLKKRAVGR